ncbi:hypothetical protein D3C73_885480 [compost metagenome]
MSIGQPLGRLGRNVAPQKPLARFDHHGGQAHALQGRSRFQTDDAPADDQGARAGPSARGQGARIVRGPQIMDGGMVGQGQAPHPSAGRQDQGVERLGRSVCQADFALFAVDRDGGTGGFQDGVQRAPAFRRRQPDGFGFGSAQESLRQAWTFVGGVRLIADEGQVPRKTQLSQGDGGHSASVAGADDNDALRHL